MRRTFALLTLWSCVALSSAAADPPEIEVTESSPGVRWTFPIGHRRGLLAANAERVVVATNEMVYSEDGRKRDWSDGGSLVTIDRKTGKRQWQLDHTVREQGERPRLGIQSVPRLDGQFVYYVSNRGELVCANLASGRIDWQIDMVRELDICFAPDFALSNPFCSPLVHGDYVYCVTGNGCALDSPILREVYGQKRVPRPASPHFICVHKETGKPIWSSNLPGENVLYSWSSPVVCQVAGQEAIAFPGGDGVLYLFEPLKGALLERHQLNPPYELTPRGKEPRANKGTQVFPVATPVFLDGLLYVSTAQDMYGCPELAPFTAFDLTLADRRARDVVRWRVAAGPAGGWSRSSPAVSAKYVFIYSEDDWKIIVVNRQNGKFMAQREVIDSTPTAFPSLHLVGNQLVANIGASIEVYSADAALDLQRTVHFKHRDSRNAQELLGPLVFRDTEVLVPAASHVFALDPAVILGPAKLKE